MKKYENSGFVITFTLLQNINHQLLLGKMAWSVLALGFYKPR